MTRIFGGLSAALFVFAAALQWNDPDPLRWLALYLGCAAVCAIAPYRALPAALPLGLAGLALVWAISLAPEVVRESAWTGSEVERELGGLVLVAIACGGLAVWRHRREASGSA